MFGTFCVCLVFVTKIVAYRNIDSYYGSTEKYVENNFELKFDDTRPSHSPDDIVEYVRKNGRENHIRMIINGPQETSNSLNIQPTGKPNEIENKRPETEKESLGTDNSNAVISYPPYTQYEVTEIISDIPDDRTPSGPILTNYTPRPPLLNLAKIDNKTDTDKLTEANIKTKKNSVTILHINAEYDDKVNEVSGNKVVGLFKGIKEHIRNFHRGIIHGIHRFFHKHDNSTPDEKDKIEKAIESEIEGDEIIDKQFNECGKFC